MLIERKLLSQCGLRPAAARRRKRRAASTTSRATAPSSSIRRCLPRGRALALARKALADTSCARRLPVSSSERFVSVGDYVTRGTKVASVMRDQPAARRADRARSSTSRRSRAGRAVSLEVDAYPGRDLHGPGALRLAGAQGRLARAASLKPSCPTRTACSSRALRHRADRAGVTARRRSSCPAAAVRTVAGTARVFVVTTATASRSGIVTTGQTVGDSSRSRVASRRGDMVADQQRGRSSPTASASPQEVESAMQWLAALCVRGRSSHRSSILSLTVVGTVRLHAARDRSVPERRLSRRSSVTTRLPGAAPEQVESEVTDKIEEAVNTISGIDS